MHGLLNNMYIFLCKIHNLLIVIKKHSYKYFERIKEKIFKYLFALIVSFMVNINKKKFEVLKIDDKS